MITFVPILTTSCYPITVLLFLVLIFIARKNTDARYWYSNSVRTFVRPSRSGIRWKRLNILS